MGEKTEGVLVVDGHVWRDLQVTDAAGRFRSGRSELAKAGLKKPWRQAWTMDHVESHVAGVMRRPDGPKEARLVINNDPCADEPFGCDRMLPHILPPGARLEIYVKDGGSTRFYGEYRGTGKAIEP